MSAITAKASRKMKKYAVLTREPRCFLGSFDFSWEQRKLGDIASDIVAGGDIDKDLILAEGQYPVIANALTGDGIVGYYDKEYRVNAPAVTVTGRGDVGHAKTRLVNFTPVVRLLSVKSEHDVFFLENAINTLKIVIESTGVPQLTVPQLAKYEVAFPRQLDEEKHIGAFFKQLDHLITLHQRKCANLCSPSQVVFSLLFATSTFSWEQRKLSEMCGTFEYGLNAAAKEFDGKNKYIRITDIDDASREFLLSDLSSPDICLDGMSKYLLSSGDIVFARTGASVGKTYIYRENDGIVYFAGFLIRAKVNQDNDAEFVFQSTLSPSYEKYIRITSQRSGQPGVNAQEYGEYDLFAPSKEEQQRIGHFLRGIDNLITLHQRECISFAGRADWLILTANKKRTTSSWEQRKVQDVADRFDNLRIPVAANLRVHGTTPYYGANGIQDYVEGFTHDGEFVLVAEDGANDLKNYPVKCVNGRIWVNNHAHVLQGKAGISDNSFLAFAISQSDIESLLVGGSRAKLNAETLMSIEFKLPCLQEQYRIGEYLTQLDHLITLHQRQPFFIQPRIFL